jgi:hypothetical protein
VKDEECSRPHYEGQGSFEAALVKAGRREGGSYLN